MEDSLRGLFARHEELMLEFAGHLAAREPQGELLLKFFKAAYGSTIMLLLGYFPEVNDNRELLAKAEAKGLIQDRRAWLKISRDWRMAGRWRDAEGRSYLAGRLPAVYDQLKYTTLRLSADILPQN